MSEDPGVNATGGVRAGHTPVAPDAVAVVGATGPIEADLGPRPLSPDEEIEVVHVRQTLALALMALAGFAGAELAAGLAFGSPQALTSGIMVGMAAAWVAAFPRRTLSRASLASNVLVTSFVLSVVFASVALVQPFAAFVASMAMLGPIALALPHLEARWLRRLTLVAWAGAILASAAAILPDDGAVPPAARDAVRLWGVGLSSGMVLFLMYRSGRRLKDSGREFQRLFQLSADLADVTEPAVLGELVARHLAEATGFEECVIYALEPATNRLVPFGSHPPGRALSTDPIDVAARPLLGRVVHDGERILIDGRHAGSDVAETALLRAAGRQRMAIIPLVAQGAPVGAAELSASRSGSIDARRLALARTLAFEAAMAIENGRLYQQLRHRSLHDPLTGLANRSLFYDHVEMALARLGRKAGTAAAILFLDIDAFKSVNDELGHAAGDRLLSLLATRVREAVRPSDTVARLGGDEFAIVLDDIASADEATDVGGRILEAVRVPFELPGRPVTISVSIGVAVRSTGGATPDELVKEADMAMYQAKRGGRNRIVAYRPGSAVPG